MEQYARCSQGSNDADAATEPAGEQGQQSRNPPTNHTAVIALALLGLIGIVWLLSRAGSEPSTPKEGDVQDLERIFSQYEARFAPIPEHEKRNRAVQMMLEQDEE